MNTDAAQVATDINRTSTDVDARRYDGARLPPDWSRRSHAFRHLDGRLPDWRRRQPGQESSPQSRRTWRPRINARVALAARSFVHYFAPTPKERLIVGTFILGMAWGAMCAIGMMAAWGIHP